MAARGGKTGQKRYRRALTRVGRRSFSVTLPVEFIRQLGWRARQKLLVGRRGRTLTVVDWPRTRRRRVR